MDKESNRYRSVSDAPLIGFVEDFRLSSLLQTNDLGQFSKKFVEHEVDFKTFLMLNESHLMDMGIDRIGSRVKLMNLITKSKDNQIQIQSKGNQKLRPGEILFEDLQFFECIGRGSFGSVFRLFIYLFIYFLSFLISILFLTSFFFFFYQINIEDVGMIRL